MKKKNGNKSYLFLENHLGLWILGLWVVSTLTGCVANPGMEPLSLREQASMVSWAVAMVIGGSTALAMFASMVSLFLATRSRLRINRSAKAKKIKAKYPGFSVVGVFLERFMSSHIVAQNILCVSLGIYIAATFLTPLPIRWDVLGISTFFLVMLLVDNFVTQYRIRKGYYLNNEAESRDLIKFIKNNADDIDFTDGNRKILSKNDLEEAVLGQIGYSAV